jgi:hypothetical protein
MRSPGTHGMGLHRNEDFKVALWKPGIVGVLRPDAVSLLDLQPGAKDD